MLLEMFVVQTFGLSLGSNYRLQFQSRLATRFSIPILSGKLLAHFPVPYHGGCDPKRSAITSFLGARIE